MFSLDSNDPFPINVELLIKLNVYTRKQQIKDKLIQHFILDTDYQYKNSCLQQIVSKNSKAMQAGKNKENIMLTTDCFKSLCMLALSESGKKFQRYYLNLEKIFKRYIILEFQQKKEEIQQERIEKNQANQKALKFQTLYNTNTQKHQFWKFLVKGSCFYLLLYLV
jgi:anti-repressor protein